jgi:transcriptional regulator with XRE-family HTH domain
MTPRIFTDIEGAPLRADLPALGSAETTTLAGLAELLRTLRRRHARQRRDSELTYRAIAARTGWSHTAVAEYFTGKTLPPTDRFDVLVALLGATPAEQGALATARDRVAENHRRGTRKPSAARLDALLARPRTPAVTVTAASPGDHWAHRLANRFPDGLLYVNVSGYGTTVHDAIEGLFEALDVPRQRTPPDAQAALYRSEVAGRRILVLLDNPRDATRLRPVLLHGAAPIAFDVLTEEEARELLIGCLGAGRVRPEPDSVAEVIASRARLPLALACAARDPRLPINLPAEQLCRN